MSTIPRTIREQVTDRIRDQVVAGDFPVGEPLREIELAEKFGVSRGPIRDAFLQLSQEGFLAYQANRGVTVRRPPEKANHDFIVSLRQQIESHVVRRGLAELTTDALAVIGAALATLQDACDRGDVAAIAKCDMAFHEAVLVGCGGNDFLPVWKLLCAQMLLAYSRLENYQQVYDEHAAIFAAIASGKKRAVVAAIKENIR